MGIGGIFGGLCRFRLARAISEKAGTAFPLGTFIINIAGAALLGLVSSINVSGRAYLLLGDGFLGAFTTFSTFMYEGFSLFRGNEKLNAFAYILGTFLLGVIGYALGSLGGRFIISL